MDDDDGVGCGMFTIYKWNINKIDCLVVGRSNNAVVSIRITLTGIKTVNWMSQLFSESRLGGLNFNFGRSKSTQWSHII